MVRVQFCVARSFQGQIDQAVLGEQLQHVVEERSVVWTSVLPPTIQIYIFNDTRFPLSCDAKPLVDFS